MTTSIPDESLSILPFRSEPFSACTLESDLFQFLCGLGLQDGIDRAAVYAVMLYDAGFRRVVDTIEQFNAKTGCTYNVVDAPGDALVEDPLHLVSDKQFGLMAKYSIAWDGAVNKVLSDAAHFSLAHVLEMSTELKCSTLLAVNFYYKQALQVLRNYLESVVVELYFCHEKVAFAAWKNSSFRLPSFRGKNGLLRELVSRGVLHQQLSDRASALYDSLNGSIHGAESQLIHQGISIGNHKGLVYRQDRLREWCDHFSSCVNLGIHILSATVTEWTALRFRQGIMCDHCHSRHGFDVRDKYVATEGKHVISENKADPKCNIVTVTHTGERFVVVPHEYINERSFTTVECAECKNHMTFPSSYVLLHGVSSGVNDP